jgi:hypothetical protein
MSEIETLQAELTALRARVDTLERFQVDVLSLRTQLATQDTYVREVAHLAGIGQQNVQLLVAQVRAVVQHLGLELVAAREAGAFAVKH